MSENAIMIANLKAISFKSKKLNEVTAEISGYINEVQTKAHDNHLAISRALARVATEKMYEEDGFKSALDYAMTTFGWKRANAYAMMQVGTKLNAGELPEGNFSVSQYREMLPLSKEAAEEAIKEGVISEDMSAKDIRAEVEVLKPKKERKNKPEKLYMWHMDGVEGRGVLTATETIMTEGKGLDWTHKVSIKLEDKSISGYLICSGGEIHFFLKGEEVTEDNQKVEQAE